MGSQFELFDLDCTYPADTCRVWLFPFTLATFGEFVNLINCSELNYSIVSYTECFLANFSSPPGLPSSLTLVPAYSLISSSVLSRNEPNN